MDTAYDLVRQSVERFGPEPALIIKPGFRTRVWRYAHLGQQVPRIARALTDAGAARGDRVLIWAVNRPEWGLGFLAAAHAGLVGVPLDVRSIDDFATKVVQQTEPRLVLASRQTEEQASRLGLPVILIESLPDLARGAEPLPAAEVAPDDLLLVMFTSGTTGDPKGVMLTHGNVISNARALVDVFPFGPNERLLSVLPLSHMFGLTCDFLAPLAAGKTVVYPVSRQPAVLVKTFREFRITMLLVVPQGLRLLANAIERKVDATGKRSQFERLQAVAQRLPRFARRILFRPVLSQFGGRLRTFAVGASALDPALATFWSNMGVTAVQGYGATEMSPAISFTRPQRNRIGTVGEPVPGVEVRIAGDGEVLARGPNRFVGYWQNPDATAAAIDADGWYHTGDLGELSEDGFLTLRGRKKDMIALPDGQKVYPDDVEAVLFRDGRIRDSAVVGLDGDGSGVRVHAVLLADDGSVAEAVVRDANAVLAGHQQIRAWSVWPDEDFPRTASMKVKKRLVLETLEAGNRAAPTTSARPSAAGTQPRPPAAVATVAELVGQVAEVPAAQVAPDSRLETDLGLDSLGRIELLSVIEEEMGAFVDDGQLEPDATVAELEGLVESAREASRDEGTFDWPLNPMVRAIGLYGLERARNPCSRSQCAGPLDREERTCVVRVERIAIRVGQHDVRRELTDAVGDRDECFTVDLQGVVAEVEALELGAERRRRALGFRVPDLLHAVDRLARLLPEFPRLAPLPVGQRKHAGLATPGGRDGDRASRPPDEVGRVRPDHQELSTHEAPARRRDCPTIISCTSSWAKSASSRWSAQRASPSSTGG